MSLTGILQSFVGAGYSSDFAKKRKKKKKTGTKKKKKKEKRKKKKRKENERHLPFGSFISPTCVNC